MCGFAAPLNPKNENSNFNRVIGRVSEGENSRIFNLTYSFVEILFNRRSHEKEDVTFVRNHVQMTLQLIVMNPSLEGYFKIEGLSRPCLWIWLGFRLSGFVATGLQPIHCSGTKRCQAFLDFVLFSFPLTERRGLRMQAGNSAAEGELRSMVAVSEGQCRSLILEGNFN